MRKTASAKKTRKAVLSDVLSILLRLCVIFVFAWFIMAGCVIISDTLKKSAVTLSQKADTNNIPMNTLDPMSGKPIMPGITSTYRGCIVGHCCGPSKSEWLQLSPQQKIATIQGFLSSSGLVLRRNEGENQIAESARK